jgi:hypothetical protein
MRFIFCCEKWTAFKHASRSIVKLRTSQTNRARDAAVRLPYFLPQAFTKRMTADALLGKRITSRLSLEALMFATSYA